MGPVARPLLWTLTMKHASPGFLLLALSLTAGACSDDGASNSFGDIAASMEGIYRIDTHTENLAACEPGGDSLISSEVHGYLAVQNRPIFGIPNLSMISCGSPADCRETLAAWDRNESFNIDFSFAVQAADGNGSLVGEGASTGFGWEGTCTEGSTFQTVAALEGEALDIVQRRTIADDYPADADGYCTTDLAKEHAAGNSCSQLEHLTATFVEDL